MFKTLSTLFMAWVLCSPALAQSVAGRPLTAPLTKNVAYVSQEVLLNGANGTTGSVAPLTVSSTGFGLKQLSSPLQGVPFNPMPVIPVSNPTTQDAALQAADNWVKFDLQKFRAAYGAWLSKEGLSMGFYNYTQEIIISTDLGPKKKSIAFNATFDISGRPTYGNAKIVDADPTIVEVTYIPKRVAAGLPSDWKYPDAGHIKWRILNKKYVALTAWQSIDTNGAFDTPEDDSTSDQAVKCLMDLRNTGCSGPVDVKELMDRSGSSYALVNYVHSIDPVYDSTGFPKMAISVDYRSYNCEDYTNEGSYGFVLSLMSDQYLAESSTGLVKYRLIQQFGGQGISPTQDYAKTVPIAALGDTHPDAVIINPTPENDELWTRSDPGWKKSVIYVAPVVNKGGDGLIMNPSYSSDMAVRHDLAGNVNEYYVGTAGDNYWGYGTHDRLVSFDLKNPQTTEEFSMFEAGFDDHMLVAVNGTIVYIGPYGGSMLELMNPVTEQNCGYSGGRWQCYSVSDKYISAGIETCWDCSPTCPSGSKYTSGSQGVGCYALEYNYYKHCDSYWFGGGDSGEESWQCTQSCAGYMVQTLPDAYGYKAPGCRPLELKTSWVIGTNIDLRPYLITGRNTIFMRTLVGGKGEGWIRLRTKLCGSGLNLTTTTTHPPATAGTTGVLEQLRQQANDQIQ